MKGYKFDMSENGSNKNWGDIGKDIRDAVSDSLRTGDFSDFGESISDAVADVIDGIAGIFGAEYIPPKNASGQSSDADTGAGKSTSAAPKKPSANDGESYTDRWIRENGEQRAAMARENELANVQQKRTIIPFNRIGNVSGTLMQVFGGIGIGVFTAMFLVLKLASAVTEFALFGGAGTVCLVGAVLSLLAVISGKNKKKRLARAERFARICGKNRYCNIDELAMHVNSTPKAVLKEIKKLLRIGYYPQGHLDKSGTCLMLDDKIYNEYLAMEKVRMASLPDKSADKKALPAAEPEKKESHANTELDEMMAQGRDCIAKLREMNDNIPGEEISLKLFRLENLLKDIFDRLKEHPEQREKMKKFMDYYLPVTLKLVGAYEEFDSLSVQGDDITEAKNEIEKTLDTINNAFGELLERLFRDTAFDVTTDAQVLQTMLAKDGLTNSNQFDKKINNSQEEAQ